MNKKLKILDSKTISKLFKATSSPETLEMYRSANEYQFPDGVKWHETRIQIPDNPPTLQASRNGSFSDEIDNAIKVYEYLGSLSRVEASDHRLWATLTHTVFWDYCQVRWGQESMTENRVQSRWFAKRDGGSRASLVRNAISSLWWAVHLTVAPWAIDKDMKILKDSDRYRYSRVLFTSAQLFVDIMERQYGRNTRIRLLYLAALEKYGSKVRSFDALTRLISKEVQLTLKVQHLDAMSVEDAQDVIEDIVSKAAERLAKKESSKIPS